MATTVSLLEESYNDVPDRTALTLLFSEGPDLVISYRELVRLCAGYAGMLAEAGVQKGHVVTLILDHGPELVGAFWGAVLHGAIPSIMPFLTEKLSPEQYHTSLSALFSVTMPGAVVTSQSFLNQVQRAVRHADLEDHAQPAILVAAKNSTHAISDFSALFSSQRKPDDIVLLQHSSGTTGLQKGVALSHQAVINQIHSYAPSLNLSEEDVIVSWLPLYHDMGLIAGFVMPILTRVPLVLMSPFDWVRAPYRLMQAVTRFDGTLSWLPNFAYNFCAQKIRARDLDGVDLSSWRAVINCSEPMHWNSHEMFLERFQP